MLIFQKLKYNNNILLIVEWMPDIGLFFPFFFLPLFFQNQPFEPSSQLLNPQKNRRKNKQKQVKNLIDRGNTKLGRKKKKNRI